ncbi:T9SS type A sorting domain-containing protein [Marinoscillum furvescens]|uniref:Putative secreted protein (Por secretion system target) n=1 Tax=Marinoscillum furvescens DSM 4134 TaxID=1122208 RepID=A0A3D9KW17_MARFU|nr:T9SS type A sorting domain-containing protein [Marinoscillum furvescens]RED92011.1 putative secreted protein (Por secretion system target) [Marinoscillum furvescens DSM 4134]
MKKVILLSFMTLLLSGVCLAQDWVVYSETFEDATDVSEWDEHGGATGFTTVSQNATDGVAGTGALEFSDAGFSFFIRRPVSATIGQEYQLKFDIKTTGWADETKPLEITLFGLDTLMESITINDSSEFVTITIAGIAKESTGYIQFSGDSGAGDVSVLIDNISFISNLAFHLEAAFEDSYETSSDVSNWGNSSGFTTPSHNTTGGVNGSGALELKDGGFGMSIERAITVEMDKDYLMTMDVKTSGWDNQATYPITLTITGIDDFPKTVYLNSLTDFTTISIGGRTTNSTGLIYIEGSNTSGENYVWIDNISLTYIDMETVIWDGANWNNTSGPTASDNVMIDGALTVNDDMAVNHLEVTGNGSLSVASGASLAIMGTASGTATIHRNTTGSGGYSIVGAPVVGAMLDDMFADYLYTWDGAAWSMPAGDMVPGTGYFVGYDAAAPTISLTGELVSGDQTLGVSTAGDGFNVVANPYMASISIADFLAANSSITSSVYLWNDGGQNANATDRGGDYVTVNEIGTVGTVDLGDGVSGSNSTAANTDIGSMQGFLVEATSDASVTFSPTMQTTTAGANADGNYYRTAEQPKLKLALAGAHYNEVLFGFRSDATYGVDHRYDATKKIGNDAFAFYSLIGKEKFAIQGLPLLSGETTLSLGYEVEEAGTYHLSIKELVGIPAEYQVYANYKGVTHNLSGGAVSLNLDAGIGTIELTLSSAILASRQQAAFKVFTNQGMLNIHTRSKLDQADISILDMAGRAITTLQDEQLSHGKWSKRVRLNPGEIYILRLHTREGILTQKFIY